MKTFEKITHPNIFTLAVAAALAILAASAFTGCDKPETPKAKGDLKTMETETAKKEVNDYKANPTATQKAQADRALASLDKEISELEQRVAEKTDSEAEAKLQSLRATRADLAASYTKGEYESVTDKVKNVFKDMGKSISDAAEKVKDAVTPDKDDKNN